MNWSIPVMKDAQEPAMPRFWLWGIALLVVLVSGFLLAVYVLPDSELADRPHLLAVAAGGPFLVWLLCFGLRLMARDVPATMVDARNQTLAVRRGQWRRWANQGMCLLAENRLTAVDAKESESTESPVNQGNALVLDALAGLPEWERRSVLLTQLLSPVAQWLQQHAPAVPVALSFQIASSAPQTDWHESLSQVAEQLTLPLASTAPLPEGGLIAWLTTACDRAPETVCCLVFVSLDDKGETSEEAAMLLLSSDAQADALKLSVQRRMTRPLLTPFARLADALRMQCGQQQPAAKLYSAWYTGLPESMAESLPVVCLEQQLACGTSGPVDVDNRQGTPGVAREAVMVSLAAQASGAAQLFSAHQGQGCLWQLSVPRGRA